ncbi:MAG: T9SS type A sorting domain-containing protein [Bacteroidota bacterium]
MNLKQYYFSFLFFFSISIGISSGQCIIAGVTAQPGDCDGGEFWVTINFEYDQVGNEGFRVQGNGENYGNFSYADLPIQVGPFVGDGVTAYEFVAIDNQFNDCSDFAVVDPVFCGVGDCVISDLSLTASDCDADDTYDLTIDFNVESPSHTHFDVIYHGDIIGYFALADLPVTIQDFEDFGENSPAIAVCINDDPNCCAEGDFISPNCGGGACEIWDLVVETGECMDDGTYVLWIDFNYANPGNDFFEVFYQGDNIGFFPLDELPVPILNFEDDGELNQGIVVCINDQPNCCEDVGFQSPDCDGLDDCEFWDFFAEAHPCNDDGLYLLDFEFNAANHGNDGFIVTVNGAAFGPFQYGETFYTVGPFAGGTVYEILIQDVQDPDCGFWNDWGPVFCDDQCHIYDLDAEVSDCNNEGEFFVTLTFEHSNTSNDGFKIVGNGNVYGFFEYANNPVTLGPFESGAVDALEFAVIDAAFPDCGDAIGVPVPDCNGNEDCFINDLVVDVTPCFDDGTFYAIVDFNYGNASDVGFRIDGNGISYGLFSYADLPISIGPLVGNGITPYEFVVRDLNMISCSDFFELGPVDCEAMGDCEISNAIAVPGSCKPDGTYNLWLNFDFANSDNIYFDVFYQGSLLDFFPLASLPVVIPNFVSDGNPVQELLICINDNPDCCTSVTFEDPSCMSPGVWPGDGNFNSIANHFDLLNIGLAFGEEGPARSVQGIEWIELTADEWADEFETGLNLKHADCDGDGLVTNDDVEAIKINYGSTHGDEQAQVFLSGTEDDPPFYVDLPDGGVLQHGNQFSASVVLGSDAKAVENLYGISFTLVFDPEIIPPSSVELQYDPSWLGVANVNLMTLDRTFADEGRIDVSMVRNDQNDVSGFGHVLGFIGVIDNIAGKEEVKVEIEDVRAIRGNEALIPLYRPVEIAEITVSTEEPQVGVFDVYPNPAGHQLYLFSPNGSLIEKLVVTNTNGQIVATFSGHTNLLNIAELAKGVYTLKLETKDGLYVERFVKM